MSVCCFTGHRDLYGKEKELFSLLCLTVEQCAEEGFTEFRTGGALGFDTLAARAVLNVKQRYPDIRLVVFVPCRDQEKYWAPSQKAQYHKMLAAADEVKILSEHYYRACMFVRNRMMVDGSALCIAFLKEVAGGTKMTVDYAKKQNLRVINMGEMV